MSKIWGHAGASKGVHGLDADESVLGSKNPIMTGPTQVNPTFGGVAFDVKSVVQTASDNLAVTLCTFTTTSALAGGVFRGTFSGMLGDGDGIASAEVVISVSRISGSPNVATISTPGLTSSTASGAGHGSAAPTLTISTTVSNGIFAIKAKIAAAATPIANNILMLEGSFVGGLGTWTVVVT